MKTYLIKKELKSVWKWAALAIAFHFFAFFYTLTQGVEHPFINLPYILISGEYLGQVSPLEIKSFYFECFCIISILLGGILAIVQIYPELQLKTLSFLMHRAVTKKEVLNSKVFTGLFVLIVSICLPFSFVVFTCVIPGNYTAPFCLEMIIPWFICIYFASCFYLCLFYCLLQEGRFLKWIVLLSLSVYFGLVWSSLIYLSTWQLFFLLLIGITIWYLALLGTFEERDFS